MNAQTLGMKKFQTQAQSQMKSLDFDLLYRASRNEVYAYVYGMIQDKMRAEDIVSNVFEKAFKHQKKYQTKKGTPKAWLFGIARNAVLDDLRKKRPQIAQEAFSPDPSDLLVERLTLQQLMKELSSGDRELLALKFWAGFNNREIADLINLSESNVGTKLARILTQLREGYNE